MEARQITKGWIAKSRISQNVTGAAISLVHSMGSVRRVHIDLDFATSGLLSPQAHTSPRLTTLW